MTMPQRGALKRVAIGRKYWLFAGHDQAAESHAKLYTLIAGTERHGIDPQKYLTSVLAKIGQAKLSELGQFVPDALDAKPNALRCLCSALGRVSQHTSSNAFRTLE